jgi:serine/threonine protein kinase
MLLIFQHLNKSNNPNCVNHKSTHLNHPCLVPLFGVVLPTDSKLTNLKIATLFSEFGSLEKVIAERRSWLTPTAQSKTIASIVLGMQFAHSLGCVHGSLKPRHIIFDQNQIAHIEYLDLKEVEELVDDDDRDVITDEDQEDPAQIIDVFSFISILVEILVGDRVNVEVFSFEGMELVPSFVKNLLESC